MDEELYELNSGRDLVCVAVSKAKQTVHLHPVF